MKIPEGWKEKYIRDCVSLSSGDSRPEIISKKNEAMNIPVYGGNGIMGYSNKSNIFGRKIVIGRVGEKCGCVHILEGYCFVTDNSLYTSEITSCCNPGYLYYLFLFLNLSKLRNKGGQPLISQKPIYSQKILLPPLPEQKAIADILSTWDEAIEKIEKLIKEKEKRFKANVQKLITNNCENWDHVKPETIFNSVTEKNFPDEELLSVTQDRGVIPRSMLEGRVMSPDGTTETYKLIKKGDFVISLRSFQGGIEYSEYRGIISPAYTVLRPKIEINKDFYKLFFKTYVFIEKYLNIAVIGIRDGKQISIPDFMTIKIPFPPLPEQKTIAETLNSAQDEINLLKKLSEQYKKQKQGLMQKLLTGEWRVRND